MNAATRHDTVSVSMSRGEAAAIGRALRLLLDAEGWDEHVLLAYMFGGVSADEAQADVDRRRGCVDG